jgi:hypothetical protein
VLGICFKYVEGEKREAVPFVNVAEVNPAAA